MRARVSEALAGEKDVGILELTADSPIIGYRDCMKFQMGSVSPAIQR